MADATHTERRFQALVEGVPHLVWQADRRGDWTWVSPQWAGYTGIGPAESLGRGWLRAVHPDDRAAVAEAWARRGSGLQELEARLRHAATGKYRWFRLQASPTRGAGGEVVAWQGTSTDIHDLRDMQDRQRVLVAELQHRTRNLMAVVQSMATRTASASADLADFQARFLGRLAVLSRVQGLLSRLEARDRVIFSELLAIELSATAGAAMERVTLDGPTVRLRSSTVQTLAMALHELVTNAVTHGALGQPQGRLAVTWSLLPGAADAHPRLSIDWRESGVQLPPQALEPHRRGHGREFLERALPYQTRAETRLSFEPDGVRWTLSIPASRTRAGDD